MKRLKSFAALALCLGLLLALPGCGSVTATEKQLFAMNSAVSIKAYGSSPSRSTPSQAAISTPPSTPSSRPGALWTGSTASPPRTR